MGSMRNTTGGLRGGSWLLLCAIAALSFVLGALVATLVVPGARERLFPAPTPDQTADVGGPFTMVDHRGERVSDSDFRGRFLLMTFSYTHSPDIGPAQLQVMGEVINRLGSRGEAVVPILVTLDPERDGPAELAAYLARFHPRFVGLTGTKEQVAEMARGGMSRSTSVPSRAMRPPTRSTILRSFTSWGPMEPTSHTSAPAPASMPSLDNSSA